MQLELGELFFCGSRNQAQKLTHSKQDLDHILLYLFLGS